MPLRVLGLQAARADGSEPTFDGQAMQAGIHLRWSFTPQLGFPPGAFWLLRRAGVPGDNTVPPPGAVQRSVDQPGYPERGPTGGLTGLTQGPLGNPCLCACPPSCSCCYDQRTIDPCAGPADPAVAVAGRTPSYSSTSSTDDPKPTTGAPSLRCECGCGCGGVDPAGGDPAGAPTGGGQPTVGGSPKGPNAHRCSCTCSPSCRCCSGQSPSAATGPSAPPSSPAAPAGDQEEDHPADTRTQYRCSCCCRCGRHPGGSNGGVIQPGGQVGGQSGPGWGGHGPSWGPPDPQGWGVWGEPFTLPVTRANWPARYFGAPDPLTVPPTVVTQRDIAEARHRLTGLDLLGGMTHTDMLEHLANLRGECNRLVSGWPIEPNYSVELSPSPDGANAPQLSLRLVEQLQLAAISPYLARALGLYFVDRTAKATEEYDYCLVGVWPQFAVPVLRSPGSAPQGGLASGGTAYDGMVITADNSISHLYTWRRDGRPGSSGPSADPGAPPEAVAAFDAAVAGVPAASLPPSMLAAQVNLPAFPWPPPPPPGASSCSIHLDSPVAEAAVTVAGDGVVTALAAGVEVGSQAFSSSTLTWTVLAAPDAIGAPIDTLVFSAAGGPGSTIVVALVGTTPVADSVVGVQYAMVHAPAAMTAPAPPAVPVSIFRRRDAGVELPGPAIVPRSLFDVQWVPPPVPTPTGDPVTDPAGLPPADGAVGYVAERADGDPALAVTLPRVIAAAPQPTPSDSPLPVGQILRFMASGLPDPKVGYQFRTAGFGIFGQRGGFSPWSNPIGIESIAGAPTALRYGSFDNSAAGGGHPQPTIDPTAWVGGALTVEAAWSGGALLAYPDTRSARLTVEALQADGVPGGALATDDFEVPAPAVSAYVIDALVPSPADHAVYAVTTPPLPALDPAGPAASLTLTGTTPGGAAVTERFTVRPGTVDPSAAVRPPGIVATLRAGVGSRLVTNPGIFIGRPAYLVEGVRVPLQVPVPLEIPIDQTTARGQATVTASRAVAFVAGELIVDPNPPLAPGRPEPVSPTVVFAGGQLLQPPEPATPVHRVDHRFYQPADFNGAATYVFAGGDPDTVRWDTTAGPPAVLGYVLERAPGRSLALADVKRRLAVGLTDPNPTLAGRHDLDAWISSLPAWLEAYNTRTFGAHTGSYLTPNTILTNAGGQRAFIEHFYGGLLDDELCVLGDVPDNRNAFARVDPAPLDPGSTVTDTVNGNGHGRTLYKLSTVNASGSVSSRSGSAGPIYTVAVRASRAPTLYRVQPAPGALVVAWSIDDNPDVAGYLVYRADDPSLLADLRWWGPDPSHPADPTTLAGPVVDPTQWHGLQLGPGVADPRLVALVNDPRVFARDHPGSDLAEVPLPPGTPPDQVLGVYRLDEFDSGADPQSQPQAFNYWLPDTGGADGTAQLISTGSATGVVSHLAGLRIGLGEGVPVVVVARYGASVRSLGSVPIRRLAFTDSDVVGTGVPTPGDPNAVTGWTAPDPTATNFYTVVAIDIAGNLSSAATPFGARALVAAGP